jgi:hypothetical protein
MQLLFWATRIASCQRPSPQHRLLIELLCMAIATGFAVHFADYTLASKYVALNRCVWAFARRWGPFFGAMNQSGFEAENKLWAAILRQTTSKSIRLDVLQPSTFSMSWMVHQQQHREHDLRVTRHKRTVTLLL